MHIVVLSSGFDHGMVNDALAASIGNLIQDYRIFVCQLESLLIKNELSLQKTWYLLQPNVTALHQLHHNSMSLMKAKAHGGMASGMASGHRSVVTVNLRSPCPWHSFVLLLLLPVVGPLPIACRPLVHSQYSQYSREEESNKNWKCWSKSTESRCHWRWRSTASPSSTWSPYVVGFLFLSFTF